ncbi:MAG TPA: TatD family hydrolase [Polyangia bacterium]
MTSPPLFDTHAHLHFPELVEDLDGVLERARAAGVEAFVCVGSGSSLAEVRNAVAMAEAHADVWAAVGIHPHDAARIPDGAYDEIERLAATHPRVVAVGETGLDYHYKHSPAAEQKEALRRFIGIARRTKRPLSLHIRDAHADAARILRDERADEIGGVIHCFTGDLRDAQAYVALGFHISLSGVVTFKSAEPIRAAAAWVPLERLLVETDCPFLAPVPLRGKRNEPAYITHTAAAVATLRGLSDGEFAEATTRNCRALFGLH